MNWQSMFDAGACTVSVLEDWSASRVPLWSGTLATGETSETFQNSDGDNLRVVVGDDGLVTLETGYAGGGG